MLIRRKKVARLVKRRSRVKSRMFQATALIRDRDIKAERAIKTGA